MNDSVDISKQIQSERRIVRHVQENVDAFQIVKSSKNKNQTQKQHTQASSVSKRQNTNTRNMLIISKRFNLYLGPNYLFFMLGFTMTTIICILLVYVAFNLLKISDDQSYRIPKSILRIASIFLSIWVCIMYLITALSDPGVHRTGYENRSNDDLVAQDDNIYTQQQQNGDRFCNVCKFKKPQNVRHCNVCGVCIVGLDHHCPWMSKCVGKKNLISFYGFIIGLFLQAAVFWITMFFVVMQENSK